MLREISLKREKVRERCERQVGRAVLLTSNMYFSQPIQTLFICMQQRAEVERRNSLSQE